MNAPFSSEIEAFANHAKGFCAWCEGSSLGENGSVLSAIWLARLHASAPALPETEPEYEQDLPELPAEALHRAEQNLNRFDGMYYRTVFDTDPANTEEPVMGDVGDDLLDTYKDIKRGLLLYGAGRVAAALWFWSYMHRVHWSKHAVGALSAFQSQERGGGL